MTTEAEIEAAARDIRDTLIRKTGYRLDGETSTLLADRALTAAAAVRDAAKGRTVHIPGPDTDHVTVAPPADTAQDGQKQARDAQAGSGTYPTAPEAPPASAAASVDHTERRAAMAWRRAQVIATVAHVNPITADMIARAIEGSDRAAGFVTVSRRWLEECEAKRYGMKDLP